MMKPSFSGTMPFLSGALVLGSVALVGCGGGGGGNNNPSPTSTPIPSGTPSGTPGGTPTTTPLPGTTATPTPVPTATPIPTAPPTTILFVSNRSGGGDIYSMLSDGSQQTRLTTAAAQDNSPSRARNGNRIVFSSLRDGNAEIYTMGVTGETSQLQRLTADMDLVQPADTEPTFSSDGTKIAWVSTRGGAANLWTMDSTGASQTQFTTEGNVSSPAYSPSGSEIAYSVVRGGASVIVAKNVASGAERVLVSGGFNAGEPRYSPNGALLVFTRTPSGGSGDSTLNLLDLSSGAITGVGDSSSNVNLAFKDSGTFSPDSTRVAGTVKFPQNAGAMGGAPQIGVASAASGSPLTLVGSNGSYSNTAPFWGG